MPMRTAWHPLLVLLLELLLPRDLWTVVAEYALTREPRRIDAVIVRRVAEAEAWHPEYLRSVLDDLRAHNIVHFKGATDALERGDALQLLSYAYQYMALEGLESSAVIALRVVSPTLTPRFRAQPDALGGALAETDVRGVHAGIPRQGRHESGAPRSARRAPHRDTTCGAHARRHRGSAHRSGSRAGVA